MSLLLNYLNSLHLLSELHEAFAEMLVRHAELPGKKLPDGSLSTEAENLYLLAALTLAATKDNHSCLNLEAWCRLTLLDLQQRLQQAGAKGQPLQLAADGRLLPATSDNQPHFPQPLQTLETWLHDWYNACLLLNPPALDTPETLSPASPLLLCRQPVPRAYLQRLYLYEKNIAADVLNRLDRPNTLSPQELEQLQKDIPNSSQHFNPDSAIRENDQMAAVFNALQTNFAIITGGPGRGKTTVLTEILAFELKLARDRGQDKPRLALCAPTGKAAARMRQSISMALKITPERQRPELNTALFGQEIINELTSLQPQTVHSLLGIRPDSDYPTYNHLKLLDLDLVAVDECSMLSLQLFSQLLHALPPTAKLLLLGDENQLASVDEGTVLAELCHAANLNDRTEPAIINRLLVNHRSRNNQPLCDYTDAIVDDRKTPDTHALYEPQPPDASAHFQAWEINTVNPDKQLKETILLTLQAANPGLLQDWTNPTSLEQAFHCIEACKILCPLRENNYGVLKINELMRTLLHKQAPYADGVPILITKNDSVTGLRNGDIGVCFHGMIHFRTLSLDGHERLKSYSSVQLPPHETAFAMTIHKSQGSDYDTVLMLLPEHDHILLTRELIYTGISRTKRNFFLLANKNILLQALQRQTARWSGLQFLLA